MIKKYLFLLFICLLHSNIMASTRIMLLGDSITYDDAYRDHPELGGSTPRPASERHGYRNHLWYLLKDAQYDVDFVGSRIAGTAITPSFDPHNEGYPGYTSYQIANLVYTKLEKNEPDIILLHIGSNDWSDSISGVDDILDEIDQYEQNYNHPIKVILAQIINRREPLKVFTRFNINIQDLVNSRIKSGDDIVLVDMEHDAGLNYARSNFQDRTHPNDRGYEKMANLWFKVLKEEIINSSLFQYVYSQIDSSYIKSIFVKGNTIHYTVSIPDEGISF